MPDLLLAAEGDGGLPRIPLGNWIDGAFDWLTDNAEPVFDAVSTVVEGGVEGLSDVLLLLPPVVLAVLFALLGLVARSVVFAVGSLAGLLLVQSMRLWEQSMETLALLLFATVVSVVIALPLGIAAAKNDRVSAVVRPVLDFMQTMPAFVYLVPAVTFFGIGLVPGVVTTIIFALPPGVRLTELGIRQVDRETVEAGHAFGSTPARSCGASSSRSPGPRSWPGSTR
ncbi:ABC transporter permease [Blastococcus brunescens]|uniref:ABC transporter permease subunit n=1 Tax=Blastococcus brunescens TaxID=1564165 RepID=A0ABZ1BB29_9ACTN|nr:ABC transporter permease subunit [Blastococcus sp. BMG 8361]WRL66475.1 ABC transporter permease subunit [Blastococcus sp. BMG 8361]